MVTSLQAHSGQFLQPQTDVDIRPLGYWIHFLIFLTCLHGEYDEGGGQDPVGVLKVDLEVPLQAHSAVGQVRRPQTDVDVRPVGVHVGLILLF